MSATISCCVDSFPKGPAWPNIRQRTFPTWLTGLTHCRERYWATRRQMSCLTQSWIASMPSEPPTAVCSSSGRGFAPPSRRTNRPCWDRHLSIPLRLSIAIRPFYMYNDFIKSAKGGELRLKNWSNCFLRICQRGMYSSFASLAVQNLPTNRSAFPKQNSCPKQKESKSSSM